MKNEYQTKKRSKWVIAIAVLAVIAVIAALVLYIFALKNDLKNLEVESQNKDNAATLNAEKNQTPVVIDDKISIDSQIKTQNSSEDTANKTPTVDVSGLSTNLNRADVQPAVAAVLAVYQDFLVKLRAVPMSQRQAVADQYLEDNHTMFGPDYSYLNSYSLHLFPQSAGVALPYSVSINSAIVDPYDPTQTVVQVFMQPDDSWSLIVYVKMNTDGTLGTFENLVIRNNQNSL
ncbi:MAG: hypothetical protein WCH58_02715 [Candidatus Saccharibacteria bacterium]